MIEQKSISLSVIDPVCGMTVDERTAISAERDGKTFYFCSEHCRKKFLAPTSANLTDGSTLVAQTPPAEVRTSAEGRPSVA